MSERVPIFEDNKEAETKADHEAPPEQSEAEQKVEARAIDPNEARKKINEIHKLKLETLDESAQSASRIIRVPLESLEPVVETIAKTWTSIRQNLSPSQKTFSKIIHNSVISNVSEFTAKTLARPYAILSGGVVAVIGSGAYLYLTRHLGYKYNYFVPILLFAAGLAVGTIVELSFKLLFAHRKK
jgi:hypothetical protein